SNQNPATSNQIDSLKKILDATKEDTTKIKLLIQVGAAFLSSKESLPYSQQALELSQKLVLNLNEGTVLWITIKKLEAVCYNDIGVVQKNLSNYPQALDNYLKSLRIRESLGMESSNDYAMNLNNMLKNI
ncbi:MAG: hypothetical protein FD136_2075, partial [Chitinophagaceae bacterium]